MTNPYGSFTLKDIAHMYGIATDIVLNADLKADALELAKTYYELPDITEESPLFYRASGFLMALRLETMAAEYFSHLEQ